MYTELHRVTRSCHHSQVFNTALPPHPHPPAPQAKKFSDTLEVTLNAVKGLFEEVAAKGAAIGGVGGTAAHLRSAAVRFVRR